MRKRYGFLFIAVLLAFLLITCNNPTSPDEPQIKVTIEPKTANVKQGETADFTATVTVASDKTVTWAVTGKDSSNAEVVLKDGTKFISKSGNSATLQIDENEPLTTKLTVTAKSVADPAKSGSATVTVIPGEPPTPTVISVTVSPKTARVEKGTKTKFTANVVVSGGAEQTVTWEVNGNRVTDIDENGFLTVDSNEPAQTLTVTATSTVDQNQFDTATVELVAPGGDLNPEIRDMWLVGIPDWTFPKGTPMDRHSNGSFTWEGKIAADSTFRFSLTDTSGYDHKWNGNWYAPGNEGYVAGGLPVMAGSFPITKFETDTSEGATSATENCWKISAGVYRITVKPSAMQMTIEQQITTSVAIIIKPTALFIGEGDNFTARAANDPDLGIPVVITWEVTGSSDPANTKFGTGDDANKLFVSNNETAASLTITARAEGKTSEPVTIEVKDPGTTGRATITLTITNEGKDLAISGGTSADIYKTGGGPSEVIFTATGASSYTWYVDGVPRPETGGSITCTAAAYTVGYHTVRLTTMIGDKYWSSPTELGFTVIAVKE